MGMLAGLYLRISTPQDGRVVHHPKLYHGWICSAKEHIDAATGGSFFSLSIEEARALIEKMVSSQSWNDECTQTHTRKVHQLEEVDMLTSKIDLLMKKLKDPGLNHLKMVDSHMMCEECG
jgi:hypothetical protein